jgi:hypothetical protein
MIIKGAARKHGGQLAEYMQNSEEGARRIAGTDPFGDTKTAMIEWDEIGRLTRGELPVYHNQLAPDSKYTVTDAQWKRMVEITMEELGAQGHDFELYFHPGVKKNGEEDKPHAHLAICRTNRDTLTMFETGNNYLAHERASKRIAEEFGWEIVPGKHAKRDREKQPEFPRAESTREEAQREKRGAMKAADRMAEIMALFKAADSGTALKAALEDAGYLLANGDRGYVVVDKTGGQSVLTRNTGLNKKELEAFMAGVPLESLSTVDDAKALQKARRAGAPQPALDQPQPAVEIPRPPVEPLRPGVEASKFVMPPEAPQPPAPRDEKLEALEKAIADRQAVELQKWRDLHAHQLRQKQFELDKELHDKLARYEGIQNEQRQALTSRQAEQRTGIQGFLDALRLRLNPTLAAEQAKERQKQTALLERRLEQERKDYIKLLEQTRQQDLDNTKERQSQQLRDVGTKGADERDRYIREYKDGQRLADEVRKQQEERDRQRRDGPEPPTRVR